MVHFVLARECWLGREDSQPVWAGLAEIRAGWLVAGDARAVFENHARFAVWCYFDAFAEGVESGGVEVSCSVEACEGAPVVVECGFDACALLNLRRGLLVGGNGVTLAGFELVKALAVVVLVLGLVRVLMDGLFDEFGGNLDFSSLLGGLGF